MADIRIVTIVGNPKPRSRTRDAAETVAQALVDLAPGDGTASEDAMATIDLADHATELLQWGSPAIAALKGTVTRAHGLVVASPTYKAAYTGLLKLFLDQFDKDELAGLPTVALMTGGSAHHALAVEVHLRPVLIEIGASVPARGLYLSGPEVDDPAPAIARWLEGATAPLHRALAIASN